MFGQVVSLWVTAAVTSKMEEVGRFIVTSEKIYPIASMYGILTYIYHNKSTIHVDKQTLHMDGIIMETNMSKISGQL